MRNPRVHSNPTKREISFSPLVPLLSFQLPVVSPAFFSAFKSAFSDWNFPPILTCCEFLPRLNLNIFSAVFLVIAQSRCLPDSVREDSYIPSVRLF